MIRYINKFTKYVKVGVLTKFDSNVGRLGNVPIERRYVESETEELGKSLIKEKTPEVFTKSDGAYVFKGSKYGAFDNVFIGSHGNGL